MAWAGSAVFTAYALDVLTPAAPRPSWTGAALGRYQLAMFGGGVTPDRDAARPATFYGAGQWLPAAEIISPPNWPARGINAPNMAAFGTGDGSVCMSGTFGPRSVIMTGAAGDLILDGSGASSGQGLCFHDWGGQVDVTGTLTVTWAAPASARMISIGVYP
jgi:hypothetical protein